MARHSRGRGRRGGRQASPRVDQARGSVSNARDEAYPNGAEAGNVNGHRDDDPSRVGQSLPADNHQAVPTLGKEEDVALPWKEFEALGIHVRRADPVFPPRPGYGAEGTPCVVLASRFLGRLVDGGLHQYDVTISPEPTSKAAHWEVMTKLVSENKDTELGGRFPAYDDRDSLFTAGALPFDTKEFSVTLSAGGGKKMDRNYKVVISHAAQISLLQLRMLLAGYPTDIPAQALLVLDTVLRDVVSNDRNDMKCVAIATKDHTLGVDAWKGLYQSISSNQVDTVVSDVSSSVFVEPLLLIEFVQKILKMDVLDRTLTKPEYDKLLKVLRGVRIEVTHLGDNRRRKYRIVGLTLNPTNDLSFESSGTTTTVIDYFREKYSLELNYKSLPCIIARGEQNPIYLPIEVCKIVPRQCYQKKLERSQEMVNGNAGKTLSLQKTKSHAYYALSMDYATTANFRGKLKLGTRMYEAQKFMKEQDRYEKHADSERSVNPCLHAAKAIGYILCTNPTAKKYWCIDSGASSHISGKSEWITNVRPIPKEKKMCFLNAASKEVRLSGIGDIVGPKVRLYNVYISNDLEDDELFVSIGQLTGEGYTVLIEKGEVTIRLAENFNHIVNHIVGTGSLDKTAKVYKLEFFNGSVLKKGKGNLDKEPGPEYKLAKGDWVLDSGCHNHMTHERSFLNKKWKMKRGKRFGVAGSEHKLSCKVKGNITEGEIRLKDVCLCRKSKSNIISVCQLDVLGYKFLFSRDHCHIGYKEEKDLVGLAHADGGNLNYYVEFLHSKE